TTRRRRISRASASRRSGCSSSKTSRVERHEAGRRPPAELLFRLLPGGNRDPVDILWSQRCGRTEETAMSPNMLVYGSLIVIAAFIVGGCLIYLLMKMLEKRKQLAHQAVVKRDWLVTGRIDFSTKTNADDNQLPGEFKLLMEERRIVESVAGN